MSENGLILRKAAVADALDIAQVRIDSWRATYRGVVPDEALDEMDAGQSRAMWERILASDSAAASVFVAELQGSIVGFAAGKQLDEPKHGMDAELAAIYLRPQAQRQRIGRSLVRMVAEARRAAGATGMIAWVLSANRVARDFFGELGAELLVEQSFRWDDELELMEAGYGWRDLDALVQACSN